MAERPETTLEALIEKAFRSMMGDIELGLPATILSYDHTTQRARVQPVARKYFRDGTSQKIAPVDGVPVMFPQGKGFAITWPLEPGDPVWLSFSGRPFDGFKLSGLTGADEATRRRFALQDCVAYPQGPSAKNAPLKSADDDKLVLGEDTGAQIKIGDGKVIIGTDTAELLDLFDQLISALQSALVATSLGPQPLDPATQSALTAIQSLLAQIKE